MDELWRIVGELAASLHTDRIASIADAISRLKTVSEFDRAIPAFGPNVDSDRLERLKRAWAATPQIGTNEIAAAFRGAAQVASLMDGSGAIELVWTGPRTGLIPTRRTEQVMLEVIESANTDIFLVTYVFYKASSVVDALNASIDRGVKVSILMESSIDHGGAVKGDGVKAMAEAVPGSTVYVWDPEAKKTEGDALSASVHAKCAVADKKLAFITSANLTSAALERNMELGLLIRGGTAPERLRSHLAALVTTKVIKGVGQ